MQLCQKYVAPGAVQGTAEKTITSCILSQTPSRARIRRSLPAGVAGHGTDWNSRDEILEDKRKEAFLCIHTRNNLFWISEIFIVLADLCKPIFFKGGPEPLEKEIHEILGSKCEDRFPDPFFDWVQNTILVRFSYLLCLCNFCKALRDMRKFLQKCQKIAGC